MKDAWPIIDALRLMGDSPEAVAAFLADRGVIGCRRDTQFCPVALFLSNLFAVPVYVNVGSIHVEGEKTWHVMPPLPVALFIRRFDAGSFGSLGADRLVERGWEPSPVLEPGTCPRGCAR